MHYATLVIIEDDGRPVANQVADLLHENKGEERWWDHWDIGGRWAARFGGSNVRQVATLTQQQLDSFHRVVLPDYADDYCRERWVAWAPSPHNDGTTRGTFVEQEMPPLSWLKEKYGNCTAVVVDVHN